EWCGSNADCGDGQCCTGGSFNRHCQSLADDGTPCQKPNDYNEYKFGCPCKEGLICSPINYCQKK
uniref:U9-ctenitoxin-Pr1a n=1 Tax=Phoneutria reidyi TaxID=272752 RepID=TX16_PHORI|nr:RecName: Full=U9-ctenitoxin-Pr1a; Short=U9-CNTX-Pr1a; AltName: Full=Non-toxic venom protein PRTx16C0 [Phoneutria reidyi]